MSETKTVTTMAEEAAAALAAGDVAAACEGLKAAYDLSLTEQGADHEQTLALMNDLAVYYGAAGQYNEALDYAEKAAVGRAALLGETHTDTLASRHNQAHALFCLGRAAEAIPVAEAVMAARTEGDELALQAMMNLAACYGAAGRVEEAVALYDKALSAQIKLTGEKHPDTLTAMRSLVNLYRAAGRVEDSVRLAKRVLVLCDEVYGANAGATVEAMQNLAACYAAQNKHDKAVKLLEGALECQLQTIGADHPDTVGVKNALAVNYVAQQQPQKAYALFTGVVKQQEKLFGEEHPAVVDALQNLAFCCVEIGRGKEALELYRRLWRLKEKLFGTTAPATLQTMQDLAVQQMMCGQVDKGLATAKEALSLTREAAGATSPAALAAAEMLADCYRDNRQDDLAATTLQEALELLDGATDGPETVHTILKLATVYYDTQQFEQAWKLSERAATIALEVLGENHPGTLNTMNILYSSCVQLGELERAREVASRCLTLREAALGATHNDTLATMQHLADIHNELGEHAEAVALVREVLARMKKAGVKDNGEWDRVWHNLAFYAFYAEEFATVVEAGKAMLKLAQKQGAESLPAAHALQIIADGQNALGQHKEAKDSVEKAIRMATAAMPGAPISQFYCTLADACFGLDDMAGSKAAAEECVRLCEEAFGPLDEATENARRFAAKFQ